MGPGPGPQGRGRYANRPHPSTAQVQPLQAPPYLASESAARMGAPAEPWAETLKTIMLVFGVVLVACFVSPWSFGDKLAFSWDTIKSSQDSTQKLIPLLIGGTGLLAVVLSLLPLTVSVRGVAAAFLGVVPIGLQAFLLGELSWQGAVGFVGFVTLIPGLLLRSEYHGALAARIMVTIGVLCVLAPLLVPSGDTIPLVGLLKSIGSAPGKAKLIPIIEVVWVLLTLLALLAWLPPPGTAGAKVLAWVFIARPFFDPLVDTLLTADLAQLGPALKAGFFGMLLLPLVLMAWTALNGYGFASVVGKSLEHEG